MPAFAVEKPVLPFLQAKAVLAPAKVDLEYYDKIIDISQARFNAGDIAKVDLATVNLNQQKIQRLILLDDRPPVDQFDVTSFFDLGPPLQPLLL